MTTYQIRIAVAECLGWTGPFGMFGPYGKLALISLGESLHGTPPEDRDKPENDRRYLSVPNYPASLDACAEFEKTMNDYEYNRYAAKLAVVVATEFHETKKGQHFSADPISATALQRCEAYLRVKGKWTE